MIVFREDKSFEDELKTWQFWHSRQHSAKQRILEVDAKNSSGMIGQVEEIAHNAVQFYWNPSEQQQSSVKVIYFGKSPMHTLPHFFSILIHPFFFLYLSSSFSYYLHYNYHLHIPLLNK